jgi:hypothetical protein
VSLERAQFIALAGTSLPVVVITGACRSGKTLLGNILATYREAEYADEPYAAMLLPMVARSKKLDEDFAAQWLAAMFRELFNDLLLLRASNFRPDDLSSIWTKKSPQDIFSRIQHVTSRSEAVAYASRHGSRLVVTLSESMPFIDLIGKAVPDLRVIHVVRNPNDVAADVAAKRWFSDEQLARPQMAQMYCVADLGGSRWHLPWWVKDDEHAFFVGLSELERGLYYWWSLLDQGLRAFRFAGIAPITVRYDELTRQPREVLDRVSASLGFTPGALTDARLQQIEARPETTTPADVDSILEERVSAILEELR